LAQPWKITHIIKTRNEEIILNHETERGNINPRGRRHFIVIIYYGSLMVEKGEIPPMVLLVYLIISPFSTTPYPPLYLLG